MITTSRCRVAAATLFATGLAACAAPPEPEPVAPLPVPGITATAPSPVQTVPFYSPVDFNENGRIDDTGSIYNTLGGELPVAAPVPNVEQGSLEDITSER